MVNDQKSQSTAMVRPSDAVIYGHVYLAGTVLLTPAWYRVGGGRLLRLAGGGLWVSGA